MSEKVSEPVDPSGLWQDSERHSCGYPGKSRFRFLGDQLSLGFHSHLGTAVLVQWTNRYCGKYGGKEKEEIVCMHVTFVHVRAYVHGLGACASD